MIYQHCNGKHDLTTVMRRYGGEPGVEEVVRWCRNCGGCVIDMDIDSCTDPGRSMSMMFPRIAEAHVSGVMASEPAEPHSLVGFLEKLRPLTDYGRPGTRDTEQAELRRALDSAIVLARALTSTCGVSVMQAQQGEKA